MGILESPVFSFKILSLVVGSLIMIEMNFLVLDLPHVYFLKVVFFLTLFFFDG